MVWWLWSMCRLRPPLSDDPHFPHSLSMPLAPLCRPYSDFSSHSPPPACRVCRGPPPFLVHLRFFFTLLHALIVVSPYRTNLNVVNSQEKKRGSVCTLTFFLLPTFYINPPPPTSTQ
ncbi:hypothetical protein BJV74DRAFT_612566 [Russula compacta]|nr:hypothetical protein BJV74DRAFT_612566 [Russula compacta]